MILLNIHPLSNYFNADKCSQKEKVPLKTVLNTNQLNVSNLNNQNKLKNNPFENRIKNKRKSVYNKLIKKKIKSKLYKKMNYTKKHSISECNFLNSHLSTKSYCAKNVSILNNTNKNINIKENKNSLHTNNSKKITKNITHCDIYSKNKLHKKMKLTIANSNYVNVSSLYNDNTETTNPNNLRTNTNIKLTDASNNNDKKSKITFVNYNKISNLKKYKNYTQNNSYNSNSNNKYSKITNTNTRHISHLQKRKYNNSQNNIICNTNAPDINSKFTNYFYTSYLLNTYDKNDKNNTSIYKSTILNNSQNSKNCQKHKDIFISNITSSYNSPDKILRRSTKNCSLKKFFNTKLTSTYDIKMNSMNELMSSKLNKDLKLLKDKLNIKLKEQTVMSDKFIKYKLLKNYFAKFFRLIDEPTISKNITNLKDILRLLFKGYNGLLVNLFTENRIIKDENKKLLEKKLVNETEILNLRKIIKEKQLKMDSMQIKFNNLINERNSLKKNINSELNVNNKRNIIYNDIKIKKSNVCDIKDAQYKKIYEINKENLNDLEALYFFDKVKMGHKKETSLPILNITKVKKNKKVNPKDKFNLIKLRFESDSNEEEEVNEEEDEDEDEIFVIESD